MEEGRAGDYWEQKGRAGAWGREMVTETKGV